MRLVVGGGGVVGRGGVTPDLAPSLTLARPTTLTNLRSAGVHSFACADRGTVVERAPTTTETRRKDNADK